MTCQSCGASIQQDDERCKECGVIVAAASVEQEQSASIQGGTEAGAQTNKTIEMATNASKHYLQSLWGQMKQPTKNGLHKGATNPLYSVVTLVLVALFFGLSLYAQLGVGGSTFFRMSFSDTFFPAFLYLAILLGVITGALYLGIQMSYKTNESFKAVFVRFANVLPITMALLVGATLSGLIGLGFIFNFLLTLALISIVFSTGLVFYSYSESAKKIEPYFGLLGIYGIVLIFIALSSDWLLSSLMGGLFF
ncbi:hypothetical protein [Shouchella patagoniensis]|uniref:hypothetical protein n=1 Tax=Shouchella patagoniensis TaxID=228576 RepID=UPI0009953302|nr:hypothetical protein [Shouchella patagoniensis]